MARVHVRVQPGARTSGLVGWYGDLPKLAVAAPPVGGAANAEAVRVLASLLGVPRRSVRLVGGAASRTKRFEVDGLTAEDIVGLLESVRPRPGA